MVEIIKVSSLVKKFKETTAVDGLSFTVRQGEVYGFLGQNGAGKSTTIRMLLSLITPTAGTVEIMGMDLQHHRKQILQQVGAIIEKPDLYNYLTALQNLQMLARLSGMHLSHAQLMKTLETVGIAERATSKVKTFSQGMKQRLGIACALVHNPLLVVLDEPTNGLDPQGIADVRNLILRLSKEEKKTVFVSSHLLSEIEVMADAMLIIDKGKKVVEGQVSELLDPAHTVVVIETTDNAAALQALQDGRWKNIVAEKGYLQLQLHRNEVPALNQYLVERGIGVLALTPRHSLEDYFLTLTTPNRHVAAYTA